MNWASSVTIIRHQLGAIVCTALDFGVMVTIVETGLAGPVFATALGAAVGAITNFFLGRHWIFSAKHAAPVQQGLRYAVVSAASLGLNALGEWLLVRVFGLQYMVGRVIVSGLVSLFWNYPMHRRFVFANRGPS